jgi:intein/homing endonuclease
MSDIDSSKAEIIAAIKEDIVQQRVNDHPESDKIKAAIKNELKVMCETEGLHGKMVIEEFVKAKHLAHGKVGNENKVNSWTAWAIGLTHKQPDGEFLPKRRAFARAGFPDIDTDFDYERRQEVYDYIIERYGREVVGNIGTYGALKMRSFINRAFKAIDPDGVWQPTRQGKEQWIAETREKSQQIIKSLPPQYGAILKVKGEDGEEHAIKTVEDAYAHCRDFRYYIDQYPDLLTHSRSIEGLLSVYGVHAAGIVISDCPLDEIAPLRQTSIIKSAGDGENIEKVYEYATQFEYNDLEAMGLIKFDILALSTLTVISQCVNLIKENYEHLSDFDIETIPIDDQKVFELYRTGNLIGVFQCEEPGMQKTMKQIGVDSFSDIVAGVALYRPGPMEFIPQYCRRKRNEEPISYFHKSIEPFVKKYLDETYGILCIHEDTLISMADGSLKPIKEVQKGDIVSSVSQGWRTIVDCDDDEDEWIEENSGKEFMSDGGSVSWNVCDGCAPTKRGDGFKLELSNGYSVVLTDEHEVMTYYGMKKVKDLNMDRDLIACPKHIKVQNSNADVDRPYKFIGDWLGERWDVSYLLGLILADGNVGTGCNVCCGSLENADKLESWINERLPKLKTHKYFHTRSWYISLSCDELIEWKETGQGNRKTRWHDMLEKLGLKNNCYNKRIPAQIMSFGDVAVRQSFVAGMMDGDGCIQTRKSGPITCHYTSTNQDLIEDMRQILSTLGISSYVTDKRIHILDTETMKINIDFFLVLKSFPEKGLSNGLRASFIPSDILFDYIKKSGLSIREFCDKYDISRANLGKKRAFISNKVIDKIEPLYDLIYGYSDLLFYRISKMERVFDQQFYDMSVRNDHTLIGNGIVLSNCYQEQVMQVCNELAGFSITDGYGMIKAVGKKKKDLLDKYEKQFVSGSGKNGVDAKVAQSYWDKVIIPFADYAFNKSHSCCYGFLSYQTAYLKAYFPEEFICSYMNVELGRAKYEKVEALENAAETMDIKIMPRNLNKCGMNYEIISKKDESSGVKQSQIRPSIRCKGLPKAAAENIIQNAPYNNMRDLAFKTDPKMVDTKAVESLAIAGFFKDKDDKGKKLTPADHVKQFSGLREDMKRSRRKGVMSQDIFG